ncbi:hypothetical protein D3C81_1580210 [compost metagenome]
MIALLFVGSDLGAKALQHPRLNACLERVGRCAGRSGRASERVTPNAMHNIEQNIEPIDVRKCHDSDGLAVLCFSVQHLFVPQALSILAEPQCREAMVMSAVTHLHLAGAKIDDREW